MADLAHLKIAEAARPGLERDIGEILDMAALVQDATTVRDCADAREEYDNAKDEHAIPTSLREDAVTCEDVSEELLENAKWTEEGYFVVPNVQDTSS